MLVGKRFSFVAGKVPLRGPGTALLSAWYLAGPAGEADLYAGPYARRGRSGGAARW